MEPQKVTVQEVKQSTGLPSVVSWGLQALFSLLPQKAKRLVGLAGVGATASAHAAGWIDGGWALALYSLFGGYAAAGFVHADLKTDSNLVALKNEMDELRRQLHGK